MQSTRSSGEETEPRYTSGFNSETNTALHGQKKEAEKLELGHPENEAWASSFGEGELENLKIAGSVDPVFEAKSAVINSAFQHIGMGAYQWKLFALCGFGWVLSILEGSADGRPRTIYGYKVLRSSCHKWARNFNLSTRHFLLWRCTLV
jgi:hypothetical protein